MRHQARKAQNDEFYTQYPDIEREMNAYLEYDLSFRAKPSFTPVTTRVEQLHPLLRTELREARAEEAHLHQLCL